MSLMRHTTLVALFAIAAGCQRTNRVEVPLEIVGGFPTVEVRINGAGPFTFVIDTGLGMPALIDQTLAEELSLPRQPTRIVAQTVLGDLFETNEYVRIESLEMGHFSVTKSWAVPVDLTPFSEAIGVPIHGLIGFVTFSELLWTLDYPLLKLVVEQGRDLTDEPAAVPYTLRGGCPVLAVTVNGQTVEMFIDSGASGVSFVLSQALIDTIELRTPLVESAIGQSLTRAVRSRTARMAGSIQLGPLEFEEPIISLGSWPMIGGRALKYYRVKFDGRNSLAYLETEEPSPYRMPAIRGAGAAMHKRRDGWVILDVRSGTPAEASGLRVGDEVLEINDARIAEVNRDGLNAIVGEDDELMRLRLRRDGAEWVVDLPRIILVP